MANANNPAQVIEGEVLSTIELQNELQSVEQELQQLPTFQRFMQLSKAVNEKTAEIRSSIEAVMVPAYQRGEVDKSVKGEWGSVTVTEADKFTIDEAALPPKFWKKVPDEAKIRKTYQLEGKAPKGTEHYKKYGIMLKIK